MFQFPPSPTPNQTFTPLAGVTYRWSGTAWHLIAGPGAFISQADADTRYVNVDEAQNTTNRIINGQFAIDQRRAGAMVTYAAGANGYAPDRWLINNASAGITVRMGRHFFMGDFNLLVDVTTGGTIGASNVVLVQQSIEGVNLTDLHYGAADAAPLTLAFDVLATITGASSTALWNGLANKSYVMPYTINAANTWETKAFTIPGDTAAALATDNSRGFALNFGLGPGANFSTSTVNAWVAGNVMNKTGDTNFLATASNAFRLRNVRLYKGSVDFGPDRRLYAEELALCQRYYQKTFDTDTAPAAGLNIDTDAVTAGRGYTTGNAEPYTAWEFKVPMRATPTITLYNPRAGGAAAQWTNFSGVDSANARIRTISRNRVIIDNTGNLMLASSHWFIAATASAEL